MSNYIDKYFDGSTLLSSISNNLESLSDAFFVTGNNIMYRDLKNISEHIEKARKEMNGAFVISIKGGDKK